MAAKKKYRKRAEKIEQKQTDYERGVADGRSAMRKEIAGLAADVGLALLRAFFAPPGPKVTDPSTPARTGASQPPADAHASRWVPGVATTRGVAAADASGCAFDCRPRAEGASSSKPTGDR